jgi:hypothetical protein
MRPLGWDYRKMSKTPEQEMKTTTEKKTEEFVFCSLPSRKHPSGTMSVGYSFSNSSIIRVSLA